jgi:hypothetical protein
MAGMTVDDLNQLLGVPSQKPSEAPSGQPPTRAGNSRGASAAS